jgi:FAD:protein FMN transferase
MGTSAHVIVVGGRADRLVDAAVDHLNALERRWSRFIPTSEVSRLNAFSGEHVVVSADTLQLVRHAIAGWEATGGLFDPTVLTALCSLGYDRDFAAIDGRAAVPAHDGPSPAPGCDAIDCDDHLGTVTLPAGVEFDPGGIGKGLAADLVSAALIGAGARGALVNVGGDLRVRGDAPNGDAWDVAIADPATSAHVVRFPLVAGAVATSSRVRRRWRTATGTAHHLVDPRTGLPAQTRHATVAVVAGTAWWAEVVSKAVLVGGLDRDRGAMYAARIVTIDDDGVVDAPRELGGCAA